MKIVIIGAVATGLKAASKARRRDPNAEITVIERGALISYGACGLPYYVGGEVNALDDLMKTGSGVLRTPAYFHNVKNVTVLTRTLATRIDRKKKIVSVRNRDTGLESELPYDKLVLATGASPIKPALPGIDLNDIYQFWHPDDAKAVRQGLERGQFNNAVIIGAGLVGMEMIGALKTWGGNVTMVELKDQVFPAILDVEMAGMVEKYMREEGVTLITGESVIGFDGGPAVTAVQTNKRTIPADLVILALGVRPNIELARSAGLTIGPTDALAVDANLKTSDSDIFAGGDCVENINIITKKKVFAPMGSTANKHGRIIGENLVGARQQFKGVLNTVVVKVLDLNVGKTGITERHAKELGYEYMTVITVGHDKPHYMEGAKIITVKLITEVGSRRILGMQAVGHGEVSKRIDVVASLLTLSGTIDDLFDVDLSYAPPYNSPIDNAVVAANALMNKIEGTFKGLSPLQVREMMKRDEVVFLDVRNPNEYQKVRLASSGNIRNIPLGELRNRCNELSKDDEIIAYCKLGLRGYEAEVILDGEDFKNVKVLEGGIVAWPFEDA